MRPGSGLGANRRSPKFLLAAVLVTLGAATFWAGAAKATMTEVMGGPGGAPYSLVCPGGSFLVGFSAKAGAWVISAGLLCAPYDATSGKTLAFTRGSGTGGPGGTPQESYCPPGEAMTGIGLAYTRGDGLDRQFVNTIDIFCPSTDMNRKADRCIASGEGCGFIPSHTSGGIIQVGVDYKYDQLMCPAGERATGVQGKSGAYLDAMGVICAPLPAVVAAPPPKVIVQTGRPVDGTPLALAPFAGTWKTDTDHDGHYYLFLSMNGNQVSGTFTNNGGDPRYNGTLTGTVNGNQLRYTYAQPAAKGKGSGFFVLLNGGAGAADDAITGSGTTDDASQTKFKWTGKRVAKVFDETFAVGTNLIGSDYRNVALNDNFPSSCRDLCAKEAPCRAWTWVKPGVQQAKAVCWLKNTVPTPNADANTTSGVKVSGDAGVH